MRCVLDHERDHNRRYGRCECEYACDITCRYIGFTLHNEQVREKVWEYAHVERHCATLAYEAPTWAH